MKNLFISIIGLLLSATTIQAQFNIITHKSVDQTELTKNELRDIFAGTETTWDDGKKLYFAELQSDPTYQIEFYTYLGLHRKFFINQRIENLKRGKNQTAQIFSTEQQVINFVADNEGSIGIVSENVELPESVNVFDMKQNKSNILETAIRKKE